MMYDYTLYVFSTIFGLFVHLQMDSFDRACRELSKGDKNVFNKISRPIR